MKERFCNNCEFLNINEKEQNAIKERGDGCPPHICTKYNKRVFHFPYPQPFICPCEECEKEGN